MRRGFSPEEREEMRRADREIEREAKQPRYVAQIKRELRKNKIQERKVHVTIRSATQRKAVKFECWRYWEIVGELMFRSADRQDAYDAARWCGIFARPGDRRELAPDITMEVSET